MTFEEHGHGRIGPSTTIGLTRTVGWDAVAADVPGAVAGLLEELRDLDPEGWWLRETDIYLRYANNPPAVTGVLRQMSFEGDRVPFGVWLIAQPR